MLQTLMVTIVVLGLALGICHLALNRRLVRRPQPQQGSASVTGGCGDTVEMRLHFQADQAVEATCRTDGCAYSLLCMRTAADLARGRSAAQILSITARDISGAMGGLPPDHGDCAQLAAHALHAAANDYLGRHGSGPGSLQRTSP